MEKTRLKDELLRLAVEEERELREQTKQHLLDLLRLGLENDFSPEKLVELIETALQRELEELGKEERRLARETAWLLW